MGQDEQLLAKIEKLLADHREEEFISLVEYLVRSRFGADTDEEKQAVLREMIAHIRDKEEHSRNENSYRQLKDLFRGYYPSGKAVENIESIYDVKELSHYGDIVFLPAKGVLYVLGDTHGDPVSVESVLDQINFRERADGAYLVFLGDYVNNGLNAIDNLITILSLREKFPDRVVLLGGNHESKESYLTALHEYFVVHWNNAKKNIFLDKYPPIHYGHLRLELITRFGLEIGEEIYDLFGEWGRCLPYMVFSAKGVMMSHTIGLPPEAMDEKLDFKRLAYAKRRSETLYSRMVSNRENVASFLDKFIGDTGANVFVVAHSHYRSGDIEENGTLVTICSSDKTSPYAGHYMENEFRWERLTGKGLKEGRKGRTEAYFAVFNDEVITKIDKATNLRLVNPITSFEKGGTI